MIFGDLVFCVHFVVLFQSCCTIVAVSGKTSSTATATATVTTTAATTAVAVVGSKSGNGTAQHIKAANNNGKPSSSNSPAARKGSAMAKQKYDLPGELGQYCAALEDCRQYAYMCDSKKQSCDCAEGYQPDEEKKTCVGAIGKRCLYDSHCIPNAYCKGQMICTCKREFGYLAPDKWSCQASAADSLHRRKPTTILPTMTTPAATMAAALLEAASASVGGVIIIPLLLVSSWQLEINLFTV
ncbi:uncharacterized protein LOC109398362 [Aedes albopictus]|uniref:EB domain-containing protein n=1 Tax=Aedes albopictus TaxID=7160 RepID=A0ABM1Y8G8_AEDAL